MIQKRLPGSVLLLLGGLVLLSGCAVSSKPLFMSYDEEGEPMMKRRFRRHLERDFEVRLSRKAFNRNKSSGPHFLLSEDQKRVKEEYGPPDYISPSFLSRHGDYVKEWLYWEKGLMFQFVRRRLVYEGPLTDKERVLVLYGFPDRVQTFQIGPDRERQNFYYYSLFGMTQCYYNFLDGKCINKVYLQ